MSKIIMNYYIHVLEVQGLCAYVGNWEKLNKQVHTRRDRQTMIVREQKKREMEREYLKLKIRARFRDVLGGKNIKIPILEGR